MSAADAYRPGDRLPLDTLMSKITYDVGFEPTRHGGRGGGGYLGELTTGLLFTKAFHELSRYASNLPYELFPIKQLVNQLINKRRETNNIHKVMRFFMDVIRLLLTVSHGPAEQRLRQAMAPVADFFYEPSRHQFAIGPNVSPLQDLARYAHTAQKPTREAIEAFFQGMLSPIKPEDRDILDTIQKQFEEFFYPPIVEHAGPGDYSRDGDTGAGTPSESDLERPANRGLLVPGYNYVGPGNPLDNGPPQGPVDEAAKHHDERYDEMLSHGDLPYVHGHGADRLMNKEIERAEAEGRVTGVGDKLLGNVIRGIWEAKETIGDVADVQISLSFSV